VLRVPARVPARLEIDAGHRWGPTAHACVREVAPTHIKPNDGDDRQPLPIVETRVQIKKRDVRGEVVHKVVAVRDVGAVPTRIFERQPRHEHVTANTININGQLAAHKSTGLRWQSLYVLHAPATSDR
jgi:hypothetical protein